MVVTVYAQVSHTAPISFPELACSFDQQKEHAQLCGNGQGPRSVGTLSKMYHNRLWGRKRNHVLN